MTRNALTTLSLLTLGLAGLVASPAQAQEDPAAVAGRYAPVVYQEYSIYEDQHLDFLRRVDFDGDWDTTNNLNNAEKRKGDERGYVYYDVKETETHFYLTYYWYYARRSMIFNIKRENHSAGCVVVVRKGAPKGKEIELFMTTDQGDELEVTVTNGGEDWGRKRVKNAQGRRKRIRTEDDMAYDHPEIDAERRHPRVFLDAWSHDAHVRKTPTSRFAARNSPPFPFTTGRGIVYHYHRTVQHMAPYPGANVVRYALLPLSQLEQIENTSEDGRQMLGSKDNPSDLPQNWTLDFPGVSRGDLFADPAKVVGAMFEVRGDFSTTYLRPNATPAPTGKGAADRLNER